MALAKKAVTVLGTESGRVLENAIVRVMLDGVQQSTYSDASGTPLEEVTTNADGFASFWVEEGTYTLEYWYSDVRLAELVDVEIFDLSTMAKSADVPTLSGLAMAGEATGGAMVAYLAAGAGAVARTVQAKLQELVSVKDFNATGDGSTDDTAAIQAAVDAHERVFFPAGNYKITSPISFSNNQEFIGDTKGGLAGVTKITVSGAIAGFQAANKGASATFHPVFRNLTINGDTIAVGGAGAGSVGINLQDTSFAVIENCSFRYFEKAVNISGTLAGYYHNLFGNEYSSCTYGIYMGADGGGNSNRVIGGRVHSCTTGIYNSAVNDNFYTCAVENCQTGIRITNNTSSVYIFCRFEGNGDLIAGGVDIDESTGAAVLIDAGCTNIRTAGHFSGSTDRYIDLDGRNYFEALGSGYAGVHQHSYRNLFPNENMALDSTTANFAEGLAYSTAVPAGTVASLSTTAGDFYSGTRAQKIVVSSAGTSRRDLRVAQFTTVPGQTYVFAARVKLNVANTWYLRGSNADYAGTQLCNKPLSMIDDWGVITHSFKATGTSAFFYFYMPTETATGGFEEDPTLLVDAIWFGPGQVAPAFGGGNAPYGQYTTGVKVAGKVVLGAEGAAIADVTGGATVDAEARTAINAILARMRAGTTKIAS